jgi:hypothetical protein
MQESKQLAFSLLLHNSKEFLEDMSAAKERGELDALLFLHASCTASERWMMMPYLMLDYMLGTVNIGANRHLFKTEACKGVFRGGVLMGMWSRIGWHHVIYLARDGGKSVGI